MKRKNRSNTRMGAPSMGEQWRHAEGSEHYPPFTFYILGAGEAPGSLRCLIRYDEVGVGFHLVKPEDHEGDFLPDEIRREAHRLLPTQVTAAEAKRDEMKAVMTRLVGARALLKATIGNANVHDLHDRCLELENQWLDLKGQFCRILNEGGGI